MCKDMAAHSPAPGAPPTRRVYVGGLPAGVTEVELRQRFSPFGRVDEVDILAATAVGTPRRFAYVTLTATDAQWRRCMGMRQSPPHCAPWKRG